MPCYLVTDPPSREEVEVSWRKEFRHNSDVAEMLCYLLANHFTELPEKGMKRCVLDLPENVQKWWQEHKARDEAKAKREKAADNLRRAKENALGKLSVAERKLLGLK